MYLRQVRSPKKFRNKLYILLSCNPLKNVGSVAESGTGSGYVISGTNPRIQIKSVPKRYVSETLSIVR
jgi:hypothetical protein